VAATLLSLAFSIPVLADPVPQPQAFDATVYEWAYGRVIDSVYVLGNSRVRDIAILREMESRAGVRLDAVSLERDQRYLTDLSVLAEVEIAVEPVGDDRCALRVMVRERPVILVKLIYPVLEYDFRNERIDYGAKWKDSNFRGRLENFSIDAVRDSDRTDRAAIGWGTSWIGWKHMGVSGRASYYHRQGLPSNVGILERTRLATGLSYPLTESRIAFSTLIGGLALSDNRLGAVGQPFEGEVIVTPSLGYLFDSRDSQLKPRRGFYSLTSIEASRRVSGGNETFYGVRNVLRFFIPLDEVTVLGLYSNFAAQLGEYPDYIRYGIGGTGSLRGYNSGVFRGEHRWFQTAELRISPWSKRVYQFPFAGNVDFAASLVAFVDGGIAWASASEFSARNVHSGAGIGFRLYSPLQDVVRLDLGYGTDGNVRPYFSTGVRF